MSTYIIKIKDCYLEWSTITDSPETYGMDLEDFTNFSRVHYGNDYMKDYEDFPGKFSTRMKRVEETGCSAHHLKELESVLRFNRAGENEETLTEDEIYQKFYVDPPDNPGLDKKYAEVAEMMKELS